MSQGKPKNQDEVQVLVDKILKWRITFKHKRDNVLRKLKSDGFAGDLAKIFTFSHLKNKYPDFCPQYPKDETCHPIMEKDLNCYHCACPHYDLEDSPYEEGNRLFIGRCMIQSKKHKYVEHKGIHSRKQELYILSCEDCLIPHTLSFVQQMDKP
ncbi:MAG TPA: hypothetical protein ENI73_11095 [Spirochaetes bacterium]|nr:hypothetical protein [Spirochaetota bacterium]